MPECVAFVDAGFLRAEGARALKTKTGKVRPDALGCVQQFKQMAVNAGCNLLRVYWYDGAFETNHPQYQSQQKAFYAIASCPGVQLRLGHIREDIPIWHHAIKAAVVACGVSFQGFEKHFQFRPEREQEGVDTLIVLDLVRLAQRRAYNTAIVLAGDRDLAAAVTVAQEECRRVVVAHPVGGGVATELRHLADQVVALSMPDLKQMLTVKP